MVRTLYRSNRLVCVHTISLKFAKRVPGNKKYSDNRFDLLPSQAYCLKVKEMDDEEFEAAVSPFVTHPHSENAYQTSYIQTSLWVSASDAFTYEH